MRVIAGRAKGRKLYSVRGASTRPITDRAKTSLFNILGVDVIDSYFLDLFAGTGQVGIEALSRGAAQAVFVEKGPAALRAIRANLRLTSLTRPAQVIRADVFRYLVGPATPFDYIYIAPPQYRELWLQTLYALDTHPAWLSETGWAIVQIHPTEYRPLELETLDLFDQRKYGSVMLCFYAPRSRPQ